MIKHGTPAVADLDACRAFHDVRARRARARRSHDEWGDLSIQRASEGCARTAGLHVPLAARDVAEVEGVHRVGIEAQFRDAGAPGALERASKLFREALEIELAESDTARQGIYQRELLTADPRRRVRVESKLIERSSRESGNAGNGVAK